MLRDGSKTDWFHEAKWGVFMHFLAAPASSSGGGEVTSDEWNGIIDGFDVKSLARQLHEARAGYFMITIGQNSGHYCSPNSTYDALTGIKPSKCSRRDLVADLHAELAPYGIPLMTYLPTAAPEFEMQAVERLQWTKGRRCAEFQRKWEAVIREWSLRWGSKVSGWWFDGCYFIDEMYKHREEPNFKSFAAAIRAGNPDSLVAWNPGVKYPPYTVDPEEDYTAGEINEPQLVDSPGRWDRQAQFHILTFLGKFWGQCPLRFNADEALSHTLALTGHGGVVTWDIPPNKDGTIDAQAFEILKSIGKGVDATRGCPDTLPPQLAKVSIKTLQSPCVAPDGVSEGRIDVSIENPWGAGIQGAISLSLEPESSGIIEGGGRISYALEPSAESRHELKVKPAQGQGAWLSDVYIAVGRDGDGGRIIRFRLPRRETVQLPVIKALQNPEEIEGELSGKPWRTLSSDEGRGLADIKLAFSGDSFAILARVGDQHPVQTQATWDGSCIEVFGVASQGDRVNQVFLVPAAGAASSMTRALLPDEHRMKFQILPCSEIRHFSKNETCGYSSSALIPLPWWLKRENAPDNFLFEVIVNIPGVGRGAMFGNLNASSKSEGYAIALK